MMVTRQLMGPIDFQLFFFFNYRSHLLQFLLTKFFKTSYFVFRRRKKIIQVWYNLRGSDFYFWMNYPFKAQKANGINNKNVYIIST